jgi:hypothetical protein
MSNTDSRTITYFDKATLIVAAKIAQQRDYNRQANIEALKELPDDNVYPITFAMIHEHKAGQVVEPHMRTWISLNADGDSVFLDVDMDLYRTLPTTEVTV